ncbi:uncharacterized protein LOC141701142 isoform X2 [Apium graveolens]|uniref:uncharacterized protein LOC141701142 isoform X2 n=1 Tax=Apium graveolens TaxID=4045 RepID=UPI003D7A6A63
MKFHMKIVCLMLVALCTTTIPTGHARLLVASPIGESSKMVNSMLLAKASPEECSDSVPISGVEDVLSVSSVPKQSPGDVSVSSVPKPSHVVPKASPMIVSPPKPSPMITWPKPSHVVPKASPMIVSPPKASPMIISPKASPGYVTIASEEPAPGHVSIASEEPSPGHVSIDSVPHTVSEPDPWPPSLILS